MTLPVVCEGFETFLAGIEGPIDAVITSPPYSGLPGRSGSIEGISYIVLDAVKEKLSETGSVFFVVGASEGHAAAPHNIASVVGNLDGWALAGVYVWDRSDQLRRPVGRQTITNDYVVHVRSERGNPEPILEGSIIRTSERPFDYGFGVTMPPDLAALLVARGSSGGDLIVDPFAGLGEVGVQAVRQRRSFLGGDIDDACCRIANARIGAMEW